MYVCMYIKEKYKKYEKAQKKREIMKRFKSKCNSATKQCNYLSMIKRDECASVSI